MGIETLGAALRQLNHLYADGVVAGLSKAEVFERYLALDDVGAFDALLGRPGPLERGVCRRIAR